MFKPIHPDYRKKLEKTAAILFREVEKLSVSKYHIVFAQSQPYEEEILGQCYITISNSGFYLEAVEFSDKVNSLHKSYQLMFLDMIIAAGLSRSAIRHKEKFVVTTSIDLIEEIILDRDFELRRVRESSGFGRKYTAFKNVKETDNHGI